MRTSGIGGFDTAKLCFAENTLLFGNASTNPEQYNLYNGLYQMAEGLEQMQHQINNLEREIAVLRQGR